MNPFSLFLGLDSSVHRTTQNRILALIGCIWNLSFGLENFIRYFIFGILFDIKNVCGFQQVISHAFLMIPSTWLLLTEAYLIGYQQMYRKVHRNLTCQYGTSKIKKFLIACMTLNFTVSLCFLIISSMEEYNSIPFWYHQYSRILTFYVVWFVIYSMESHLELYIQNLNSCLVDFKKQNLSQVIVKIRKISKHFSQFLRFFGPLILALIFFNICGIILMCFYLLIMKDTQVADSIMFLNIVSVHMNIVSVHIVSFHYLLFRPSTFYDIVSKMKGNFGSILLIFQIYRKRNCNIQSRNNCLIRVDSLLSIDY